MDQREYNETSNIPPDDLPEVQLAKAGGTVSNRSRMRAPSKPVDDGGIETEGQLTIDVYQTPTDIVVESAIAGVEPDDIDIDVTNDAVTIKGKRHRMREVKAEDYLYQECYWGRFSRSLVLPQEVDADNAAATFKNGILTLRLPKLKREKQKKIKVRLE